MTDPTALTAEELAELKRLAVAAGGTCKITDMSANGHVARYLHAGMAALPSLLKTIEAQAATIAEELRRWL